MSLPLENTSPTRLGPLAINVDAAINAALDDKRLVGTVVLIARDGELVYRRAAGLADRENNVAMREDTIFRLASITKPIVAITAMRLVEQGRIGLDDPITKWLPDFRPRLPDGTEAVIRIHHLLTHTSGLGYAFAEEEGGPYHRAGVSDGIGEPGLSLAENLRRIASAPCASHPEKAGNIRWRWMCSAASSKRKLVAASMRPWRNWLQGRLALSTPFFPCATEAALPLPI